MRSVALRACGRDAPLVRRPFSSFRAIATGGAVLAAQAKGADFAYVGSAFIATEEARASDAYKAAVIEGEAADIVHSSLFTGVHGNYLRASIAVAGLDPDNLPQSVASAMSFEGDPERAKFKAWRDIWGAGQGVGAVTAVMETRKLVERLKTEYATAARRLAQGRE